MRMRVGVVLLYKAAYYVVDRHRKRDRVRDESSLLSQVQSRAVKS